MAHDQSRYNYIIYIYLQRKTYTTTDDGWIINRSILQMEIIQFINTSTSYNYHYVFSYLSLWSFVCLHLVFCMFASGLLYVCIWSFVCLCLVLSMFVVFCLRQSSGPFSDRLCLRLLLCVLVWYSVFGCVSVCLFVCVHCATAYQLNLLVSFIIW